MPVLRTPNECTSTCNAEYKRFLSTFQKIWISQCRTPLFHPLYISYQISLRLPNPTHLRRCATRLRHILFEWTWRGLKEGGIPAEASNIPHFDWITVTTMTLVYFDITIGGTEIGKIVMMLYNDVVPRTTKNFQRLCTAEMGRGKTTGKQLSFKGSTFHRIIPGM